MRHRTAYFTRLACRNLRFMIRGRVRNKKIWHRNSKLIGKCLKYQTRMTFNFSAIKSKCQTVVFTHTNLKLTGV